MTSLDTGHVQRIGVWSVGMPTLVNLAERNMEKTVLTISDVSCIIFVLVLSRILYRVTFTWMDDEQMDKRTQPIILPVNHMGPLFSFVININTD